MPGALSRAKRSDNMKREKESTIRVYKIAKDKAIELSKRYGLPMKTIVSCLIELCVDYDLLRYNFTGLEAIKNHTSNFQYAWMIEDGIGEWYGELQKLILSAQTRDK